MANDTQDTTQGTEVTSVNKVIKFDPVSWAEITRLAKKYSVSESDIVNASYAQGVEISPDELGSMIIAQAQAKVDALLNSD